MPQISFILVTCQRGTNLGVPFTGAVKYDYSHFADHPTIGLDCSYPVGFHNIAVL
ncbi:hypothetical protein KJ937_03820 [Patescibacteria group bacterium]|nr:hypothetical protein [Patescibacteria group bacterium]